MEDGEVGEMAIDQKALTKAREDSPQGRHKSARTGHRNYGRKGLLFVLLILIGTTTLGFCLGVKHAIGASGPLAAVAAAADTAADSGTTARRQP